MDGELGMFSEKRARTYVLAFLPLVRVGQARRERKGEPKNKRRCIHLVIVTDDIRVAHH